MRVGIKTALKAKADKTDVDAKLARKADASALEAKAGRRYVDTELAKKADASALEVKADKTEIVSTILNLSENDVKQLKQILGLQERVA